MKSTFRATLGLVMLAAGVSLAGCGDDDDSSSGAAGSRNHGGSGNAGAGQGGAADEGALECEVVGELCHEADTGSGPAHDCHELGHQGEATACAAQFADCIGTCVHDDDGGSDDQDPKCLALGELCHEVDDTNGPLHECHELGHTGDPKACGASFDDCATKCLAARELLPEPGEGGTSSGGASSGGAGGVGLAGATQGGAAGASFGGGGAGGAP